MPDSTARRERLANPFALAALAGLFALAFFALMPERDAFRPAERAGGALDAVDSVDVAYLRARAAAGEPVAEEVRTLVSRLLESGRPAPARALLAQFPDIALGARDAFLLELEGAAAALVVGNGAAPAGGVPDPALAEALGAHLERLRDEPALQDAPALARGAWLSRRLERPALTARLHARLAELDPANAPDAWAECGHAAAAAGARALAIDCYRRAIGALAATAPGEGTPLEAGAPVDEAFDLRLALLGQLGGEDDAVARGATVDALLAHGIEDPRRLEALARALLAVERPGDAASVHGRLAELRPSERGRWWREAARWSEAAGRPDHAAAWLDRAAEVADGAERATLQRRVEALLVAAGLEIEVLGRVATRIEGNPGNAALLREGVALARRTADLERASDWNEALLERAPDDADALGAAIDIALARTDLDAARAAAERAVFRLPDAREARVRLAQIAEWSGEPEVATAQWRILAASGPDGTTLRELVRLAELTLQPAVAADAARRLALLDETGSGDASEGGSDAARGAPDVADIERIVRLYELAGRPDEAAAAVEQILAARAEAPTAFRAASLGALARLHERHARLADALDAWRRRAALVGADREGTLARVALHWRRNERDAAGALAEALRGRDLGELDARAATLLSEIAWRDRRTWLAQAVAPSIARLEDPARRALHGRRLVDALREERRFAEAIDAADRLWRETGDPGFAVTAMDVAVESGDTEAVAAYLVAGSVATRLGEEPGYWSAAAALRLSRDDVDEARRDYERALELAPEDSATLASLLWLLIDAGESVELERLLDAHAVRARDEPALWSVYALARLGLGRPEEALAWFERLSDRIGTDYALLLGYADALEATGRVDDALRLRRHAFARLRPALVEALGTGAAGREALLREYVALAARHGALDDALVGALLDEAADRAVVAEGTADRWREDVAIAYLLSGERHEHARLVMARLHAGRAAAPAWQALSVALAANELDVVAALLASGEPLSVADRILALRAVGDERGALAVAADAMRDARTPATRDFAAERHAELRAVRPSWAEGFARRASRGALDVTETGVAARHTFADSDVGLRLEALRASLDSDTLDLEGRDERTDASLSLLYGNSRRGLRLDLGIDSIVGGDDVVRTGAGAYARSVDGRRELSADLMLSESATESPELRVGATRDRASLAAESAIGYREYVRIGLDATALRTRTGDELVARGASGRAELGVRGALGGTAWSASVAAMHARHERASALPDELALSADATLDSVLAPRATTLALGTSFVRGGGVGTDFPRTGAPRWFVDGSIDHDWPARSFGLRMDTGLGLRVLGGDELAFTLSHDTRATTATGADGTVLGVGYRFHF